VEDAVYAMDQRLMNMFRAYDIRGNTDEELTPPVMEQIGRAYGTYLQREDQTQRVAVGRDSRITSEELKEAFIRGLRSTGVEEVVDLGHNPFGVVLFYAWDRGTEAAYVTASHLPTEWNGVKFYHPSGVGYTWEENQIVRDIFRKEDFEEGDSSVRDAYPREEYLSFLCSRIDDIDMDLVLDCGNGVAGLTAPRLFDQLGAEVTTLFEEPDGTFPNRTSDITEESMQALQKEVASHDLGIAYDGDSDRCGIMTHEGRLLEADEIAYLVLDTFLEDREGTIIANVECSRLIEEVAEKHDCDVVRVRVGHTYLYDAVLEHDAIFGVEKAGHFAAPHIFPLDDAVAVSTFFAEQFARADGDVDERVEAMPTYYRDRIAFECPDEEKFEIVERLQGRLSEIYRDTNERDGIRVDLSDGWILIRASNTSPKIRLTVEAEDRESFEELRDKFGDLLEREIEAN
jgi:phosphomannomutase